MIADYYNTPAHDLLSLYYLTPESEGNEPIPGTAPPWCSFTASDGRILKYKYLSTAFCADAHLINGAFSGATTISAPPGSRLLLRFVASNAFSMFSVSIPGLPMSVRCWFDNTA